MITLKTNKGRILHYGLKKGWSSRIVWKETVFYSTVVTLCMYNISREKEKIREKTARLSHNTRTVILRNGVEETHFFRCGRLFPFYAVSLHLSSVMDPSRHTKH